MCVIINDHLQISEKSVLICINSNAHDVSLLIRFLHYIYDFRVDPKYIETELTKLGFGYLNNQDLLSELNKASPNIEINNGGKLFSLNFTEDKPISYRTENLQKKIVDDINVLNDLGDPTELLRKVNEIEFDFISYNVLIMSYLVAVSQKKGTFDFNNSYALSFDFKDDFSSLKLYCQLITIDSNFSLVILKNGIEHLKYKSDMIFLMNAFCSVVCYPALDSDKKNGFEKLISWFLLHMNNAVIHKLLIEAKPITHGVPSALRKAVNNTTRLTFYYQMEKQYSYKMRLDLPHIDVDKPHINFYYLDKEMIGPITEAVFKKYSELDIVYRDCCDQMFYFDPSIKLGNSNLENEAKEDIIKYRHKNVIIDNPENYTEFNNLFDEIIQYLCEHTFWTINFAHQENNDNDHEVFSKMKIRGLTPLLCLGLHFDKRIRDLLISQIPDFPSEELGNLNNKDLLELFYSKVYF